MSRYALFITGAPATGKSSVAEALYNALPHFALLQKDMLKEALYDALPAAERDSLSPSSRLSESAMHLLWSLAPHCPRVLVEANFPTADARERERFQSLQASKLEVHCWCPPAVAMQRFVARAAQRHPAHILQQLSAATFQRYQDAFRLSPVIEIDTSAPVDITQLLQQVHQHWPELSPQ